MTTFFTADTHFGHGNIILYCDRPFINADDRTALLSHRQAGETSSSELKQRLEAATHAMNEEMIKRWNETVGEDDHVWHLGDFCRSKSIMASDILRRLNGKKHLIRGNHDPVETYGARGWVFSECYAELRLEKTNLILFHYAMRVWNGSFAGAARVRAEGEREQGDRNGSFAGAARVRAEGEREQGDRNGSFAGKALQLFGHSHGMLAPLPGQCDVGVDCWDFRPVTLAQIKDRIGA